MNRNLLLLVGCVLIWGSSFILMHKGLQAYSYDQVGAMRISFAFLATLPILLYNIKKLDAKYWKFFAVVGIFGNGIPAYLFPYAQQHIESHLAGALNGLTPVWVLILGILIFGQQSTLNKWIGIALGLSGAIVLSQIGNHSANGQIIDNRYGWFCVLATACYGISSNTLKNYLQDLHAMVTMSGALACIGIPSMIYLFSTDFVERTQTVPNAGMSLLALLTLAVLGTVFSSVLFIMLLQRTTALFASTTTYLMPVVSLMWGIVYGESLHYLYFVGLVLILAGVWIVGKDHKANPAKE